MHKESNHQLIRIMSEEQVMYCYENDVLMNTYPVSTGKNGLGEQMGSECTPRGWHRIHSIIGLDNDANSVFVGRVWTGERYDIALAEKFPQRDWILTRILQLDGLEPGRNKGGQVDSLARYIYIHGTPDSVSLDTPGSRGCVRMRNKDIIALADWVNIGALVCIE